MRLDRAVARSDEPRRGTRDRRARVSVEDGLRRLSVVRRSARDKVNLDIFWLRDESLEDTANLPEPDVLAAEIVEDLQAALEQFSEIAEDVTCPFATKTSAT